MKSSRAIWMMMRREVRSRLFSKAFVAAQITTVVLIFAVFGLGELFGDDDPLTLGTVGEQPASAVAALDAIAEAAETEIEVQSIATRAEAEQLIEAGELDAAVVDGMALIMDRADEQVITLVTPAWQQAGLIDGLTEAGLDQTQVGQALERAAQLDIVELDPEAEDADARESVSFASVVLMFLAIQLAGAYIMMAVFEEKSSKVVELVLSSVPARFLLLGKVFGIAVLGIIQVAVLAGSALLAASLFSSSAVPALSAGLIATAFIWFLLGYFLYGSVFAAGASLAPRQEDAQSTMAPITMVLVVAYFAVIATAGNPESLAARIISWIPLSAPFAMPGRIASRSVAWWEVIAVMGLTAVAAAAVLALAERIYVRSVIHTDRTLTWREAWSLQT